MEITDPAQEWQRLTEHYREITDGALLVLAEKYSDLTEIARKVLTRELFRKLEMPDPEDQPDPAPQHPTETDPDSPYAEDREMVEIATVWRMRDALSCPQCHSEDIVLDDFVVAPEAPPDPSAKFRWTCASCGHQ